MLPDKRNEILKAALKSRIACLNWSKANIQTSIGIGVGRFEDLQRCDGHIKDAEDLLSELEGLKQ